LIFDVNQKPNLFLADSRNLSIKLIQHYGMAKNVADHLAKTYGTYAWEVCESAAPTAKKWPKFGNHLSNDYPYIDADVSWACREYACTIEDVLSRRTRLAFLNKDAALEAIPTVADIMATELGWSETVKEQQVIAARKYINTYGGRISSKRRATMTKANYSSVRDVFDALDRSHDGFLQWEEVEEVANILGCEMPRTELAKVFQQMDKSGKGAVNAEAFEQWWNESADSPFRKKLSQELGLVGKSKDELKKIGGGVFFG
jgi:glycerol-3-phosphate dehydrogenase